MTQEGKVNVPKKQLEVLAKEAKKDIVKAYAHVGGPDKAWEFFQKTGGDYAPEDDGVAGRALLGEGKFVESTRVYKKIIAQNMDSPRICEWQNKIVRNTLSAGTKRDQVQEIERLGAVYDKVGEMKTAKKDQTEECRNSFHDTVEGAGADLAQGSAADEEPGHLRARQVRLQGVPRPLPEGQGRLRDALLLRRAAVDAARAGRTRPSSTRRSSR